MAVIHIVVDNKAAEGFVAEHGFSLWIEADGRHILFDTGNKDALSANLATLKLDLGRLTDLVLSHGHYDHSGGVESVLSLRNDVQVYLHQAAVQPRYVREEDGARPVRMPPGSMRSLWNVADDSIHWLTHPFEITGQIGLSGPIPRRTGYEDTGGQFYYDPQGKRPDPIDDDNALWLQTNEGLIVCVGCSHAGIVNTLQAVMDITGRDRVRAVIGGLHLINASPDRLKKTAAALNEFDIAKIVACHCTGDESFGYLEKHLSCELIQGYVGCRMDF